MYLEFESIVFFLLFQFQETQTDKTENSIGKNTLKGRNLRESCYIYV